MVVGWSLTYVSGCNALLFVAMGHESHLVFGWLAAELRKQLQHAIEMGQTRAVSINKLVEDEFAITHVFVVFLNVTSQTMQELALHF